MDVSPIVPELLCSVKTLLSFAAFVLFKEFIRVVCNDGAPIGEETGLLIRFCWFHCIWCPRF